MRRRMCSALVLGAVWVLVATSVAAGSSAPICETGSGWLASGQTSAYGAGSDGDLQAGVPRSFTDNGDGTITDNETGLMWEKKSDDGSVHDKDNVYTWALEDWPYTMSGTMVTTFLAALNGGSGFAGYTDWRIPNVYELQSLVNFEHPGVFPAFTAFQNSCTGGCAVPTCSCTLRDLYYSSTTIATDPDYAWVVNFFTGGTHNAHKTAGGFVRAVRSGS
jgi:hypothetical protein